MKYFKNIKTLEELRREYRRLIKINHPDNGGSEEIMKEINNEYEELFERLKSGASPEEKEKKYNVNEDEAIREMINKIINLNVTIDIIGKWIWISGNTYGVKETLKALGFKWCNDKKVWAWHYGIWIRRKGKKNSLDTIKEKYGCQNIKRQSEKDKLE